MNGKFYRSFLLRCWREGTGADDGAPIWRFLLQEIGVAPESARGFPDFEQLVAFLRGELLNGAFDSPSVLKDELAKSEESE